MKIFADTRPLFAIILFFGLAAMTARSATDPDLWWHLRSGQWIVETGHVPHTDPFSFTRGGHAWVAHEWLSEVIFYGLWKVAGIPALIIFSSLITTAGFLLLYWRCPAPAHWAAAATVLGAWASAPCWGTRPQMFTFTLASLFLWLLEQADDCPWQLLWIPPLFLLWVNLHGGFAVGPVVMLLYAAGLACEAVAGTTPWHTARGIMGRVLLAILACFALVPLNPSGARLYRYPLETVNAATLRGLIVEWLSPDFHQSMYLPCLIVIMLLTVCLAWSRFAVKGRVLLPLFFMLLSALDAVRHIPIFVLIAIPVIAGALSDCSESTQLNSSRPTNPRFRPRLNQAVVILMIAFTAWRWTSLVRDQPAREAALFPQRAVDFLRANHQPTRLFAYYDWGGYALAKLYPQYRVFVDGRSDLYGDDILSQSQTAVLLHNGWRGILDDWNVDTILIPIDFALTQALFMDSGWAVPYRDSQAVIFVRTQPATLPPEVTSGTLVKTVIK